MVSNGLTDILKNHLLPRAGDIHLSWNQASTDKTGFTSLALDATTKELPPEGRRGHSLGRTGVGGLRPCKMKLVAGQGPWEAAEQLQVFLSAPDRTCLPKARETRTRKTWKGHGWSEHIVLQTPRSSCGVWACRPEEGAVTCGDVHQHLACGRPQRAPLSAGENPSAVPVRARGLRTPFH